MELPSRGHGAVEEGSGSAPTDPVAVMGTFEVVELQEAAQAALEGRPVGKVLAAEDDSPVFAEDRLLQPLHKAIGPGMARLDPGLADPQRGTRGGEGGFEFIAPIRQHALQRPAGAHAHPGVA